MKEHLELDHHNVWTSDEKTVFFEKMMNYYKKFGKIAAALPNKSTADCVKFYYRTKKHIKYKEKRDEMRRIKAQKRKLQSKEYRAFITGVTDKTEIKEEPLPTFDSPLHTNPKPRKPTIAELAYLDRMNKTTSSKNDSSESATPSKSLLSTPRQQSSDSADTAA